MPTEEEIREIALLGPANTSIEPQEELYLRFADEYFVKGDSEALDIARQLGYTARSSVQFLLAQPIVQERLRVLSADLKDKGWLRRADVEHNLMSINNSDISELAGVESLDDLALKPARVRRAVNQFERIPVLLGKGDDGEPIIGYRTKFKMHSKNDSLALSAKMAGWMDAGNDKAQPIQIVIRGRDAQVNVNTVPEQASDDVLDVTPSE